MYFSVLLSSCSSDLLINARINVETSDKFDLLWIYLNSSLYLYQFRSSSVLFVVGICWIFYFYGNYSIALLQFRIVSICFFWLVFWKDFAGELVFLWRGDFTPISSRNRLFIIGKIIIVIIINLNNILDHVRSCGLQVLLFLLLLIETN